MAESGSAQPDAVQALPGAPDMQARGFLHRALLRRRLRFLRHRRELALHDLGGLVFEAHRRGEARDALAAEKLAALDALASELVTLQRALDCGDEVAVLREPGISACPNCSTIHDSAASYCPHCGRATRPPRGE